MQRLACLAGFVRTELARCHRPADYERRPWTVPSQDEIIVAVLEWDTFQDYGLAVWCDKTLVLGALRALNGNLNGAPMLLDAIGLVDVIVWFDRVIVDGTLRAEWPVQIAGAITPRHLSLGELSDLRAALEETGDGP